MDYEEFASLYCAAHRVPVSVFSDNMLLCSGSHAVQDFSLPMHIIASLPAELPPLWYAHSPEQLYFGGITLPDSGNQLLIGPVLSRPASRLQTSRIICRLGRKEADIPVLMRGLDSFQKTDLMQLKAMLCLLALHFYPDIPLALTQVPFAWAEIFPSPAVEIHELSGEGADPDDIEKRLLACVRYGRTAELTQLLNETVYAVHMIDAPVPDIDTRRQYIIGANMLCSREAVNAGLSIALANELANFYLDQITRADNARELDHIFYRLITDYAGQVQHMNLASFSTPVASRVHHYVYAHIYEKLSTGGLAAALHLSESYLCKIFKKETGTTIVAHIQKCKVQTAEYLLSTHQYTAAQISDLLCFSSQSYFTSVFRKYTGKTPVQFQDFPEKPAPPHR